VSVTELEESEQSIQQSLQILDCGEVVTDQSDHASLLLPLYWQKCMGGRVVCEWLEVTGRPLTRSNEATLRLPMHFVCQIAVARICMCNIVRHSVHWHWAIRRY